MHDRIREFLKRDCFRIENVVAFAPANALENHCSKSTGNNLLVGAFSLGSVIILLGLLYLREDFLRSK